MDYLNLIVSILSGLAVCIPLIIKLTQYIQEAVKAKNWGALLALVADLMSDAETLFDNGADRKAFVIDSVYKLGAMLDYDIEEDKLSALIDNLCALSKKVNVDKITADAHEIDCNNYEVTG